MTEKLKPCPFCGKTPELYFDGDDTYVVECKHHDWGKRDEDGTRFAADIAIYAEAESKVNENLEWYAPPHELELAKRKAIAAWNRRADEKEGR